MNLIPAGSPAPAALLLYRTDDEDLPNSKRAAVQLAL